MMQWLGRQEGGKHRPATDAISDAAADVDDYYHPLDHDHEGDDGACNGSLAKPEWQMELEGYP